MGYILDKNCTPVRPKDQALFVEKHQNMQSIFVDEVQTHKGKEIVRLQQATNDAQKIDADLVEHYNKSTAAVLDDSKILSFLTDHKLGKECMVRHHHSVHSILGKGKQLTKSTLLLDEMKEEITSKYRRLQKQGIISSSSNQSSEDAVALMMRTQLKGSCNVCGKIGHKGTDCDQQKPLDRRLWSDYTYDKNIKEMFDIKDRQATISVGDGKQIKSSKVGKWKGTFVDKSGKK